MWVPFNEGWGQYETERITSLVKQLDPTRLVNPASGWADRGSGDVYDIHHYPDPAFPQADGIRAIVLGEFGGLGLPFAGHMWEESNWGYSNLESAEDLMDIYEQYYDTVFRMRDAGLSACIYTQLTDVETEANGLMTYDRELMKADTAWFRKVNTGHFLPAPRILPLGELCHKGDSIVIDAPKGATIHYTLDGSQPGAVAATYDEPFVFSGDVSVKAIAIADGRQSRVKSKNFKATDITRPMYTVPYSPKYKAGGDYALLDGKRGSLNFRDGRWQGIKKENFDLTFSFDEPRDITGIEAGFLEATGNGIFPPASVKVYFSSNGMNFTEACSAIPEQPEDYRDNLIHNVSMQCEGRSVKWVRFVAENPVMVPDWHRGRVREAWIFADEIIFR